MCYFSLLKMGLVASDRLVFLVYLHCSVQFSSALLCLVQIARKHSSMALIKEWKVMLDYFSFVWALSFLPCLASNIFRFWINNKGFIFIIHSFSCFQPGKKQTLFSTHLCIEQMNICCCIIIFWKHILIRLMYKLWILFEDGSCWPFLDHKVVHYELCFVSKI